MKCIIKRREPIRSEATLEFMKENKKRDPNLFLEFCEYHRIKLRRNNGVYQANVTPDQFERLETSILVEEVREVEYSGRLNWYFNQVFGFNFWNINSKRL